MRLFAAAGVRVRDSGKLLCDHLGQVFQGRLSRAWLISLMLHSVLLVAVGLMTFSPAAREAVITLIPSLDQAIPDWEPLPKTFSSEVPDSPLVGGGDGFEGADLGVAANLAELSELPEREMPEFDFGQLKLETATVPEAVAPELDPTRLVRGAAAVGVTGAEGAIDQITEELMQMTLEGPALVVWILDRSGSLIPQRQAIEQRLARIYEELGVIAAQQDPELRDSQKPLLTAVMAFGNSATWLVPEPTDDVDAIRQAVLGVELDISGNERVFSAIHKAAEKFRPLRRTDPSTGLPRRNVAIVVFTDEAGDDLEGMDPTVTLCRKLAIPVYVVGVPAPFGRQETLVKWIDPDPSFDQSPQWSPVRQGPETLYPERIKLYFTNEVEDSPAIDSGFGPYALTRLCYETGGIYFAVHPNRRNDQRKVRRGQTASYTAFLETFFDPETMRRYRPDYVSLAEYKRRINTNGARQSLIEAARRSWVAPMGQPQLRFVRRDEADLAAQVTRAQRLAAKLQPFVDSLYEILKQGTAARDQEIVPRWQAGYDLALGRAAAVRVRTAGYNTILAQAKRGLEFSDEMNNTWVLAKSQDVTLDSKLKRLADEAHERLQNVIDQHPNTPWALLAKRELAQPLGWKWTESFTNLAPPENRVAGNNPQNTPRDEERRMLERPKRRQPPKL